jgi:hypothetical protein
MIDDNNWNDEHSMYLMGLRRIGNREDVLNLLRKHVHPVIVLAYCSDHNVAVHLHFIDMYGCLKVPQGLGCKIWNAWGRHSLLILSNGMLSW